jgi:hypothetical protein
MASGIILVVPYTLGLTEFAMGPLKSHMVSKSGLALRKSERAVAVPTVQRRPPRRVEIEIKWERTKMERAHLQRTEEILE